MITKYTNAIDGEVAIMLLYGEIGVSEDSNGNLVGIDPFYFAEEMYWHKRNNRKVLVKINSPGGQVFAGYAMIDALIECEGNTHIVGMAASMAGVFSQFGVVRTANDFSALMIHGPSGGKSKGDQQLTDIVRQKLTECLAKRSKMSEAQIKAMMEDKQDHWFDASDMLNKGLVDKVISTTVKFDKNIPKNISGNISESFKIYENIVNSLNANKQKPKKMEETLKTLGAALKIENADESKIIAAFQNSASEVQKLKTENENLKNEVATLKKSTEDDAKKRANTLIENAIKAGKIDEKAKDSWVNMAIVNFDAAEKAIEGMKGAFKSISAATDLNKEKDDENKEETYEDLAKNNPAKLRDYMENHPDKYAKLEKAYLNKAKTQN